MLRHTTIRLPIHLAALALCGVLAAPAFATDGPPAMPGPDDSMREMGAHPPGPPSPGRFGPLALATRLAALETYVGITAGQLDAWRAYTDALQALAVPPRPEPPPGPRPDLGPARGPEPKPPGPPPNAAMPQDVESLPGENLARDALIRGEAAQRLIAAAETLRGMLKPEQIERLRRAGPMLPPPPPDAPRPRGPGAPDRDGPPAP